MLGLTDRPPKPDEVEMEGKALSFGDERNHPRMGLFCIQPLRNETETFPDPKDMGIHGEGLPSQTEKEKTGERLRSDPFQGTEGLFDLLRSHPSQEEKSESAFPILDPLKKITDPFRFLVGQSTRSDRPDDRSHLCPGDIFPKGKSGSQSFVSQISVPVVSVLGEDGLEEDLKRICFSFSSRNPVSLFQKKGNPLNLCP